MKTIEVIEEDIKIEYLIISHKFKGLKNIVVSGKKIYQLPCTIKNRSYGLKEIVKKGYYYWIGSKAFSTKKLKELIYRRKDRKKLRYILLYPF